MEVEAEIDGGIEKEKKRRKRRSWITGEMGVRE